VELLKIFGLKSIKKSKSIKIIKHFKTHVLVKNLVFRGVYVGRFQPIHIGHCHAIKYILREVDELVIIVGSSQHSHTFKNPFTCGERISMIRLALMENNIEHSKYLVVPIPDVENHAVWVSLVVSMIPRFVRVYSNDPLTKRLFEEAKIEVKEIPLYEREKYSATEIRRRILNGEEWQELLPTLVTNFILDIDGVDRIQRLKVTDNM